MGAEFATCDVNGLNALHYAAQVTRKDLIPLLLSAGDKAKPSCGLQKSLLTVQDQKGYTPIHYSAEFGSTLSFELLAPDEIVAALALADKEGCTPLLIACKFKQSNKIAELLKLDANAKVVDNKGNNALWHYFIEVTVGPEYALAVNPSIELEIIQSLLQNGCPLFNGNNAAQERDVEHIASEYVSMFGNNKNKNLLANQQEATFEYLLVQIQPTDLAALENNLSFFNILPPLISPVECWGAALSAMYFHTDMLGSTDGALASGKGSNKCLASLFDGGAVDVLLQLKDVADKSETKTETETEPPSSQQEEDAVLALQSILFKNISILGWAIKSKNEATLTFLLRKGQSPNASVDTQNNNCLHWAVLYGTPALVYALLDTTEAATSSEVMLLEAENKNGHTAAMLGAKSGTFENTKAIIQFGASSRRALGGKYWAWILAVTLQRERREINTQTGLYGNDDVLYFPVHPNELNAE